MIPADVDDDGGGRQSFSRCICWILLDVEDLVVDLLTGHIMLGQHVFDAEHHRVRAADVPLAHIVHRHPAIEERPHSVSVDSAGQDALLRWSL